MPSSGSRASQHWISKKYSLRRRWPVYVMMLLLCVTVLAILVLLVVGIDSPARPAQAQELTSIPAAIR